MRFLFTMLMAIGLAISLFLLGEVKELRMQRADYGMRSPDKGNEFRHRSDREVLEYKTSDPNYRSLWRLPRGSSLLGYEATGDKVWKTPPNKHIRSITDLEKEQELLNNQH